MNKLELALTDKYLSHQISLLRFTVGEQNKTLVLLKQMQVELKAKLRTDLTDFGKARVNKVLKEATEVIDDYYKAMAPGKAIDSLIAEVRKYKSVEEFVKKNEAVKLLRNEYIPNKSIEYKEYSKRVKKIWDDYNLDTKKLYAEGVRENAYKISMAEGEKWDKLTNSYVKKRVNAIEALGKPIDRMILKKHYDLYPLKGIKNFDLSDSSDAQKLVKTISSSKGHIGVRGIYKDEIGKKKLRLSFIWEDNVPTSRKLKGTSVLYVDKTANFKTVSDLKQLIKKNIFMYGDTGIQAIVFSKKSLINDIGSDIGEAVFPNAKVIGYINTKTNKSQLFDTWEQAQKSSQSTNMLALAQNEAQFTANTFAGIGLDASLPSEAALKALVNGSLIEGHVTADWWAAQGNSLKFKYSGQVRQGIAQGETLSQIVRRVFGSKRLGTSGIGFPADTLRRNAFTLVHNSVMQVANDSRMATFKANDDIIKGMRQLSTLDSHTSLVCITYSGAEWDLDGNPINGNTLPFNSGCPRHWGCRSLIVPITLSYKELGIDVDKPKGTRASDLGQISSDTTFDEFLKRHDVAYADDLLGPGRAKLWRDGKITLSDLLGQTGRPLTLEQLKKK